MDTYERFSDRLEVRRSSQNRKFGDELRFSRPGKENGSKEMKKELERLRDNEEQLRKQISELETKLEVERDEKEKAAVSRESESDLLSQIEALKSTNGKLTAQVRTARGSVGKLVAERNTARRSCNQKDSDLKKAEEQCNSAKQAIRAIQQENHAVKKYLVQVQQCMAGGGNEKALAATKQHMQAVVKDETMRRLLLNLEQLPRVRASSQDHVEEHRRFMKRHFTKLKMAYLRKASINYDDIKEDEQEMEKNLAYVNELLDSVGKENLRLENELRRIELSTVALR